MKLILERGDDAEVTAAASNSPVEVFVLLGVGRKQLPVRAHHVGRDEVVAGEAILAVEPAEAAPEGQPCDTGQRNDSEGGRQAKRLCLVVELAQRKARL